MAKLKKQKQEVESTEQFTCITAECNNPARWKGLCSHCYGQAKTLIDGQRTTWEELYSLGLAIDDRPFMIAFELAKQESLEG